MGWNTDSKDCEYSIRLKVTLHRRLPPKDNPEKMEREQIQSHIDAIAGAWLADKKNQQNLMNMILGNTGILI